MTQRWLVILPTVRDPSALAAYYQNAVTNSHNLSKTRFLILTENFCDKRPYRAVLRDCGLDGSVLNQSDRSTYFRENHIGKYAELIPRRSHAETSFGLLYMWMERDVERGLLIDDDTLPIADTDFFGEHSNNLSFSGPLQVLSSTTSWVNVLWKSVGRTGLYPRGYPYSAMNERLSIKRSRVNHVLLSQGLWTNVPDLDAVRILCGGDLQGQSAVRMSCDDYGPSFSVAPGNFTTVCSMNLAFDREIIPAFYQFKMDDNPWCVGRFDDIWSGVVAKRVMDSMGAWIICGHPLCEHNKAPRSTFKDLAAEAPGLEVNERFSTIVGSADLRGGSVIDRTSQIARALSQSELQFVAYCGRHLRLWLDLMERLS